MRRKALRTDKCRKSARRHPVIGPRQYTLARQYGAVGETKPGVRRGRRRIISRITWQRLDLPIAEIHRLGPGISNFNHTACAEDLRDDRGARFCRGRGECDLSLPGSGWETIHAHRLQGDGERDFIGGKTRGGVAGEMVKRLRKPQKRKHQTGDTQCKSRSSSCDHTSVIILTLE